MYIQVSHKVLKDEEATEKRKRRKEKKRKEKPSVERYGSVGLLCSLNILIFLMMTPTVHSPLEYPPYMYDT